MSFSMPTTTTSGFSFGLSTATATPAGGGFSFGTTPAAAPSQIANAPKPTLSFGATGGGDAGPTKPLSFGAAAPNTTAPIASIAPTGTLTTGTSSLGLGGGGLFGATAKAPTTVAATTTAGLNFGFGTSAATQAAAPTATTSLSLAKSTSATLTMPGTSITTTSAAPTTVGGFANLSTATKTTDSAVMVTSTQMTYNQLEEYINKWTLELEEQEKIYTDQATQINAWDQILIANNQKILDLNDAVQKVKSDQQTLEQELEFIATQHKELEESIIPLQQEFQNMPQLDTERSQTYLMVENLDTQLKQMSEDLKEIIDSLNETNKGQENTDPIIQIGKILNAIMGSLQWIDSSSSHICNKLENISKMYETFKRDSEQSLRSAYYN